ncbi:hypothetical protein CBM2605_B100383 [Cupriavidus neocaledonicus]|uniref:Uncharacterized protein n=1 Tax=Cupriavidus neocaledonicus TaxID=1040979 RepID=A0ABY1V723_9BURK|nr:hypothetical protein CBM2605_B100383 [Cupriavidus neocaledonicus]
MGQTAIAPTAPVYSPDYPDAPSLAALRNEGLSARDAVARYLGEREASGQPRAASAAASGASWLNSRGAGSGRTGSQGAFRSPRHQTLADVRYAFRAGVTGGRRCRVWTQRAPGESRPSLPSTQSSPSESAR